MTAVEVRAPERMPTQAAVNGHVRDRYINATMTREARIAWRLEHLDEWRRDLESLAYFDPDCPYDVAHEYDHDWSTDPDYGDEGIGFSEFEEDGALIASDARPRGLRVHMLDTVRNRIGCRASSNPTYVFVPQQVEPMGRSIQQGSPVDQVRPDLLVMPAEADLQEAYDREPDRVARRCGSGAGARGFVEDHGHAGPGRQAATVPGPGGRRIPGLRPRRQTRTGFAAGVADVPVDGRGGYHQVDPDPGLSEPDANAYRSEVFGTHIRFQPDPREDAEEFRRWPVEHWPSPRFQWWDAMEARWRDRVTDAEFERQVERKRHARELRETRTESLAEGDFIGEVKTAVAALHAFLSGELRLELRDQIANHWREHGPPPEVINRILAVQQTPSEWRSLIPPDEPNYGNGPTSPPVK